MSPWVPLRTTLWQPPVQTKVVLISKNAPRQIFKLFPAKIWILKSRFWDQEAIKMILIKIQGDWVTHGISSKVILIAKTMRKKNFKIQMLAGNSLKICLGAFFEISMTLKSGNFNFKLSQRYLELFPDFFELKLASGPQSFYRYGPEASFNSKKSGKSSR